MAKLIKLAYHKPHEKSWTLRITFFGKYHICAHLITDVGVYWDLYFSRNATPWASTIYFGSNKAKVLYSYIRRKKLGLFFNPHPDENYERLSALNKKMEQL